VTGTAVRPIERAQDAIGSDLDELVDHLVLSRTSLAGTAKPTKIGSGE
jgi:hypothetical protein